MYFKTILNESQTNKSNILDTKTTLNQIYAAIHNAPDRDIFSKYKLVYTEIYDIFQGLDELKNDKGSKPIYDKAFQLVLTKLCSLTKDFSKIDDAVYGANIMRYLTTKKHSAYIKKLKDDTNGWIYFKTIDLEYVRAVLHGIPELIIPGENRNIPVITLPIFFTENKSVTVPPVVPGACQSTITGETIVNDTGKLYNSTVHDGMHNNDINDFFKGAGKDIKSIISIAIPISGMKQSTATTKGLPLTVAVLNIDCDKIFPLGEEDDYYATYSSLIRPLAYLFSIYLERYFKLLEQ